MIARPTIGSDASLLSASIQSAVHAPKDAVCCQFPGNDSFCRFFTRHGLGKGQLVYRQFKFPVKNRSMDVIAAARALNRKAVQKNWHHFCDPTLAFIDPGYENLLALWRNKSGSRNMPARSDITPRDLKDILRTVLLFERVSQNPSRYRWRLIGTGLTSILGENTGKTLEESLPPEHIERWTECGDMILEGAQPLRFLGRVHIQGREYLDAENLFVPLANDNGEPSFILGQCRYTPRRSETEDIWENQMASLPGGLL